MTRQMIGELLEIMRYPVKSMAGERLHHARVANYGVYGDRSHAFMEDGVEGWERYVTARDIPQLLAYRTAFASEGDSVPRAGFPSLEVTSADGQRFSWNEQLLKEIQPLTKRPISLLSCDPEDKQLAVDAGGILIITDRTVRQLESVLGYAVDHRRFRANMVIALEEYAIEDTAMIGQQLHIGDVVLAMHEACERCMMITIDPDTLERDPAILRKVNAEMGLCFGIYASVIQTGEVRAGDQVYLA